MLNNSSKFHSGIQITFRVIWQAKYACSEPAKNQSQMYTPSFCKAVAVSIMYSKQINGILLKMCVISRKILKKSLFGLETSRNLLNLVRYSFSLGPQRTLIGSVLTMEHSTTKRKFGILNSFSLIKPNITEIIADNRHISSRSIAQKLQVDHKIDLNYLCKNKKRCKP